ncbi:hypothetical protein IWQ47_001733 [Aquimarina sp. EL_43]|nr:hypothetical protein [Aquimarina sp. EL_43]MBG6148964.1 hypothetical protein [Aquimarina sp. EL_32]MBG6168662.1 hypothetical protein [Aquimarina sp. EL_43]
MKLIGFIKEHNDVKGAVSFADINKDALENNKPLFEVIDYLNKGTLVFSWMGYSEDLDNGELITPDSYHTDGVFVWPAYFPYYLNKYPEYKVNEEFLVHLANNNFHQDELNPNTVKNIEKWLSEKLE